MRIMKITTLIVFIFSLNVTANSFGQNQKINLKMNSSIKDVLEQLENVSDYRFVMKYDESILYKQVKVNFSNDEIETVLDNLLSGSGFTYKILDRYIAIIPTTENLRADQPQKSISGKVKDSSGASLPGVPVVVKGTKNGLITFLYVKYNLTNLNL